jgi:uncharacterized membrane protein
MKSTILVHIASGAAGLISGYIALSATKGATLHRRMGLLFVFVMSTLAITGMLISVVEGVAPAINVPSALLTFYLVITALTAVRPVTNRSQWIDTAGMLTAAGIALSSVGLGMKALVDGGREAGMAFPLFLFAGVATLAAVGDRRAIRSGGLRGRPRLKRHLWRMCFALFIASIAFFLGQGRVPEMFRAPAVLAGGVLLPIAVMLYWLWRLRANRYYRLASPTEIVSPSGSVIESE